MDPHEHLRSIKKKLDMLQRLPFFPFLCYRILLRCIDREYSSGTGINDAADLQRHLKGVAHIIFV